MKKLKFFAIISLLMIFNYCCFAQSKKFKCEWEHHYGFEKGERKGEFFEQRIKNLKEKGFITEQEEKDLFDKINELKNYRNEVWADDKLTKEEYQKLKDKEKELREKIHEVLERAKGQFMEEKTIQEREKFFNEKVDRMLKDKKITKKQAEELKKQHKELLLLEEKIWSDDVMTKEELKNLSEQKRNFNKKIKEVLMKKFKNRRRVRPNFEKDLPKEEQHFE